MSKRILILGESGVGKTFFINQLLPFGKKKQSLPLVVIFMFKSLKNKLLSFMIFLARCNIELICNAFLLIKNLIVCSSFLIHKNL